MLFYAFNYEDTKVNTVFKIITSVYLWLAVAANQATVL